MAEHSTVCVYFDSDGPGCTERTLQIASKYALEQGIQHVLVATTSGKSAVQACQAFEPSRLVAVTHSYGFAAPNTQELLPEHRRQIEAAGAHILTAAHAFGGIGRAVRRKFSTYQVDELIAFVLRTFSQGVKVACEITLMCADAGLVNSGEEVLAMGGTGSGLDSAVVLRAATSQDYFDLRVLKILCKPRENTKR